MQSGEIETFFTHENATFPVPSTDGNIEITPFLAASEHTASFFGLLGTVFTPVKNDLLGNVTKLRHFINQHPGSYLTVNDIITKEANNHHSVAIDSLLWLKRALEFVLKFLDAIVVDTKTGNIREDLRPLSTQIYEETLKPYHGWFVQKVVGLIMRASPNRHEILKSLALGKEDIEEEVIKQMEWRLVILKNNLDIINQLYSQHNLSINYKV